MLNKVSELGREPRGESGHSNIGTHRVGAALTNSIGAAKADAGRGGAICVATPIGKTPSPAKSTSARKGGGGKLQRRDDVQTISEFPAKPILGGDAEAGADQSSFDIQKASVGAGTPIGSNAGEREAKPDAPPSHEAPPLAKSRRKAEGRGAIHVEEPNVHAPLSQTNPAQAGSDEAKCEQQPIVSVLHRSTHARKGVVSGGQSTRDPQGRSVSGDQSHRNGGDVDAACVGHVLRVTQNTRADAGEIPGSSGADGGQSEPETQWSAASISNPSRTAGGESGQVSRDTQTSYAALTDVIAEIRVLWRHRQAWHAEEKALTLRAKALCRGLAHEGDKKEADVIYNAALGIKGEHPHAEAAYGAIFPLIGARDHIEKNRDVIEKRLVKLAKGLPTQSFIAETRGVRLDTLAKIVGEAGDIGSYSNPGKLWKRMGLAPHNGVAPATHKSIGTASANDWVLMGYSGSRRSVMWNVGACFIKAGGPYRELYDARKEVEIVKCEAIAADPEQSRRFTTKTRKYAPKLHAHNRAQRYIEKRFLRELWRAWRAEVGQLDSDTH